MIAWQLIQSICEVLPARLQSTRYARSPSTPLKLWFFSFLPSTYPINYQIAEELSNEEIRVQDWENLFKQDGADIALEQKIHTPQLTKLLTIRAIVIPQTVPEFLQWLNIQKISDVDESQKTSWAFQKKIKQFYPQKK